MLWPVRCVFRLPRNAARYVVVAVLTCGSAEHLRAQSGSNVLIVTNEASSTGDALTKSYVERHGVPNSNICRITTGLDESIDRTKYAREIEEPIWRCIATD